MSTYEDIFGKDRNTKDPNSDENMNLLDIFQYAKKKPENKQQEKKKKRGLEQHEYAKRAEEKSSKVYKNIQRFKQESNMTHKEKLYHRKLEQARQKWKQKENSKSKEKIKLYGPTIINIFGDKQDKKEDKSNEKKQKKPIVPFKQEKYQHIIQSIKKQQKDKRQNKRQKIKEKQIIIKKQRNQMKNKARKNESSQEQQEQEQQDENNNWRKQLRKLTHYNPHAKKYKILDKMKIQESGAGRIITEEKISARYGQYQEDQELNRQLYMRKQKKKY